MVWPFCIRLVVIIQVLKSSRRRRKFGQGLSSLDKFCKVWTTLNKFLKIKITFVMFLHFSTVGDINTEFLVEQFNDIFANAFDIFGSIIPASSNSVEQNIALITLVGTVFILWQWKVINILPMTTCKTSFKIKVYISNELGI
jgi:hypothetical protein